MLISSSPFIIALVTPFKRTRAEEKHGLHSYWSCVFNNWDASRWKMSERKWSVLSLAADIIAHITHHKLSNQQTFAKGLYGLLMPYRHLSVPLDLVLSQRLAVHILRHLSPVSSTWCCCAHLHSDASLRSWCLHMGLRCLDGVICHGYVCPLIFLSNI